MYLFNDIELIPKVLITFYQAIEILEQRFSLQYLS